VFPESVVHRIIGREKVEAVEIERAGAIKPFQMAVQRRYRAHRLCTNSELFRDQLELDERGYLLNQ